MASKLLLGKRSERPPAHDCNFAGSRDCVDRALDRLTTAGLGGHLGVLFNQNQTTLVEYPGGIAGSYTVPTSVTNIGEAAFYGCPGLSGVYFTGNAPSSDWSMFYGDNNATAYYLPGTTGWGFFSASTGIPAVLWLPQAQTSDGSFGVQANQFGFNINWASGRAVVVEACTNLVNPAWSPVATNPLTGGTSYFSDPQWTNYPVRFYRLRSP